MPNEDQFYWMTTLLSARGVQSVACAAVAVGVEALGVIALGVDSLRAAPLGGIPAAIAAVGVVLAAVWSRRRWPSRCQSKVTVVFATCVLVFIVLNEVDVTAEVLMTAAAFAPVALYANLFHRLCYGLFTSAAAAVSIAAVTARVSDGFGVALAAAFCVTLATVGVLVTARAVHRSLGVRVHDHDVEVFSRLMARHAFDRGVADQLGARTRKLDQFLVLTVIAFDVSHERDRPGKEGGFVSKVIVLHENARASALITRSGETELMLSEVFDNAEVDPYACRLHSVLTATESEVGVTVGIALTPLKGLAAIPAEEVLDQLIENAVGAIARARALNADYGVAALPLAEMAGNHAHGDPEVR